MEKNNSTKQVLLSVLGVAILVVAVVGVSFAFFTYSKQGNTVNTITTGTLVFKYEEKSAGINLTDAVPMTDAEGTALAASGEVFDFTITSTVKGTTTIGYEISATETTDPTHKDTLDAKYVKMRLASGASADVYGTQELAATHFSKLTDSAKMTGVGFGTKVLANGSVVGTAEGTSVSKFYRLQMWMADTDANGTATEMREDVCQKDGTAVACDSEGAVVTTKGTNGKTFTIKVNVFANDTSI